MNLKTSASVQELQAALHAEALAMGERVSLFREPDAGNPPVRFDERGVETEAWFSFQGTQSSRRVLFNGNELIAQLFGLALELGL